MQERKSVLLAIADDMHDDGKKRLLSARLKACIADATTTEHWITLVSAAENEYEPSIAALLFARYARFAALNGNVDTAWNYYNRAIEKATYTGQYGDASSWLQALRSINLKYLDTMHDIQDPYANLQRDTDLYISAQLLNSHSTKRAISNPHIREQVLSVINDQRWHEALIYLRQYLWHSVVTSSWMRELEAHKFLGNLFTTAKRYQLAVDHYVSSGIVYKSSDLKKVTLDVTINRIADIHRRPKWQRAAEFSFIAAFHDLIPDSEASELCSVVLEDVLDSDQPALFVADNVHINAIIAFSELAEFATGNQVTLYLEYVDSAVQDLPLSSPSVEEAHVKALFAIARKQDSFRRKSVSLAMDFFVSSNSSYS